MTAGHAALAELFPPFVRCVMAPCGDDHPSPHPEEAQAVARAVPRRRREFLSGRFCAHQALRALGADAGPILTGPRREPLWPAGVVGSIAHAGDWSVAVVARATDATGLGVDIEVLEPPLTDGVDRLVRTPAERGHGLPDAHPLARHAGKITFSVKEAVYKALFPLTGWPLEFGDLTVTLDAEAGGYAASVDERFGGGESWPPGRIHGRFRLADGYVLSGVCLGSGTDGCRFPQVDHVVDGEERVLAVGEHPQRGPASGDE